MGKKDWRGDGPLQRKKETKSLNIKNSNVIGQKNHLMFPSIFFDPIRVIFSSIMLVCIFLSSIANNLLSTDFSTSLEKMKRNFCQM